MNLFATALLGIIEAVIERITGDSAAFQNGKLVAVRRKDLLAQKVQQKEKAEKAAAKSAQRANAPLSIYNLPLPIPEAPGKGAATLTRDADFALPASVGITPPISSPTPAPTIIPPSASFESRAGAAMITAEPIRVEVTPAAGDDKDDEDDADGNDLD